MATLVLATTGIALSARLYALLPNIARWVGASEALAPECVTYGRVLAFFMPFQMLSMAFHPLLNTAEQPGLELETTIANAAANILLDWTFVAGFGWGMRGAAIATGMAWLFSAANDENKLYLVSLVGNRNKGEVWRKKPRRLPWHSIGTLFTGKTCRKHKYAEY